QQCTHLCQPAVPHTCASQQCHTPVPRSATYLCPEVPPTCAHQCHPPVPTSATHLCSPAVLPVSTTTVPPVSDASQCHLSVLAISAAYPRHFISAAYQCRLLVPISAASSTHISEGEKLPV
ncbi:unnamed protein product, partial [Staurois parvus]